jgi:hypothetical protein
MEEEKQFFRKPREINTGNEELFKDKLTPDTSFLNHLLFEENKGIESWDDESKAIQEINFLKAKKKELEARYTELVNHLNNIYSPVYLLINEAIEKINPKVQEYAREHSSEIKLEELDGIKKGEMILGDFKVERTETIKIKKVGKLLQPKSADDDNEEIFSESTIKTEAVAEAE